MDVILYKMLILHFVEYTFLLGFALSIFIKYRKQGNKKNRKNKENKDKNGWYILSILSILLVLSCIKDDIMDVIKKDYVVYEDKYVRINHPYKMLFSSELWTDNSKEIFILPDQLEKNTSFLKKSNKELKDTHIRITYAKRTLIIFKIEKISK